VPKICGSVRRALADVTDAGDVGSAIGAKALELLTYAMKLRDRKERPEA
jgi:hypothetical protein